MLDISADAIVLPETLRPGAFLTHQGGSPPGHLHRRLEAAGVTVDGRIHPTAASIIDIMSEPDRLVQVARRGVGRMRRATVWANATGAVLGRPAHTGHYELRELGRDTLVFHVAEAAGIRSRPAPLRGVTLCSDAAGDAGLRRLIADATTSWIDVRLIGVGAHAPSPTHVSLHDAGALGYWSVEGRRLVGLSVGDVLRIIDDDLEPDGPGPG